MELDGYSIRHPEGAELQLDADSADWVPSRLLPWGRGVGMRVCSVVPTGYEAYVRIFHHAEEYVGGSWVRRRWSEIAQSTGRQMHPNAQFERLGSPGERRIGTLDQEEAESLIAILRGHSAAADVCWLAIWDGWAWFTGGGAVGILSLGRQEHSGHVGTELEPPRDLYSASKLSLPAREYYIYKGSIDVVPRFEFLHGNLQTPNMWWPADRAWFVGTEIDYDSTVVACSRECATTLLRSDLEALEISSESRLDIDGDKLNAHS